MASSTPNENSLSTTKSFTRTNANYSHDGTNRRWEWLITAGDSNYVDGQIYGSSPAHRSKLFGKSSGISYSYGSGDNGTLSSSDATITFS